MRAVKDRPDLELVGEAGDGRNALEQIKLLEPDVAVLDIRMPGLEGTQVLSALKRDGNTTEVLFLSAFMEAELAYTTVAEGARGYLSKESSRQEICDAIVSVSRGDTALAPEVQSALAQEIMDREHSHGRPELSPRESEVLAPHRRRPLGARHRAARSTSARPPSRPISAPFTRSSACPTGLRRSPRA